MRDKGSVEATTRPLSLCFSCVSPVNRMPVPSVSSFRPFFRHVSHQFLVHSPLHLPISLCACLPVYKSSSYVLVYLLVFRCVSLPLCPLMSLSPSLLFLSPCLCPLAPPLCHYLPSPSFRCCQTEFLLQRGADPDARVGTTLETPLMVAARRGQRDHIRVAAVLLQAGCDLSATDVSKIYARSVVRVCSCSVYTARVSKLFVLYSSYMIGRRLF